MNLPEREEILERVNEKLRKDRSNEVNQKVMSWRMPKAIRSATG